MIVLIFILKMLACSALFYTYYFFFLRDKGIHQYNRWYLLASVILSIILPFLKIPLISVGNETQAISKTLNGIAFGGWEKEFIVTSKHSLISSLITSKNILLSTYAAGLMLAVVPVINSLLYVRSLSQKHTAIKLSNVLVYDTQEPGTPFSFFNSVFWNNKIPIETYEGRQIFMHELLHVKQKHSYDVLFMQLACCTLWFNPFCFFMSKELKIIHEFLADSHASSGTDKYQYAELLVKQAVPPKQIFISNQFFYNQIKRRITMILSNNTGYNYPRKIMAVPVVLLIFCACSVKNKDVEKMVLLPVTKTDTSVELRKDGTAATQLNSNEKVSVAGGHKYSLAEVAVDEKIFTKVEIESSYPGGVIAWTRYLEKAFKYPQEAQDKEIQGTVIIQFVVDKEGNISNVEAVDGPNEGGLRNEAIRVITNSGKWNAAIMFGHKVKSYKKQPVTFMLEAQ